MKIIQVINFNICKNWLLKKRFLEIKRVGFSQKLAFLVCNLGTGHYVCRGGEGGGKICWKDQNVCKPPADHLNSKSLPLPYSLFT